MIKMLINCKTIIQYMKPLKPVQVTCRLHPVPRARSHEEAVSVPGGGHEQLQCWPVSTRLSDMSKALLASFYIKRILNSLYKKNSEFCFPCSLMNFFTYTQLGCPSSREVTSPPCTVKGPCTKPRACHPAGAPEQVPNPEPWPQSPRSPSPAPGCRCDGN